MHFAHEIILRAETGTMWQQHLQRETAAGPLQLTATGVDPVSQNQDVGACMRCKTLQVCCLQQH